MLKWIAGILGVLFIGSVVYNFIFWGNAKEKIKAAENKLTDYREKHKRILLKGDSLDAVVAGLRETENGYKSQIESLNNYVETLKAENKQYQSKVILLFQPHELVSEMRRAFPELKEAPLGVTSIPSPETGFPIKSFQVPLQFVSTFIGDHMEVENLKQQASAMGGINAVYKNYVLLQDSIINLKEQKAGAYKEGLDYGLKRYEELMKEYISTLKNPPKIEWPSVTSILTAGAVGLAAGVLISK